MDIINNFLYGIAAGARCFNGGGVFLCWDSPGCCKKIRIRTMFAGTSRKLLQKIKRNEVRHLGNRFCQSMNQSIDQSNNLAVTRSINQPNGQSSNQGPILSNDSIDLSINQSIDRSKSRNRCTWYRVWRFVSFGMVNAFTGCQFEVFIGIWNKKNESAVWKIKTFRGKPPALPAKWTERFLGRRVAFADGDNSGDLSAVTE